MSSELGALLHTEVETTLDDGRKVVMWHTPSLIGNASAAPSIVIASGFCRRMHAQAGLAMYLVKNGLNVYRYDPVDHVGLSDGDIDDFTLDAGYRSMQAVLRHVRSNANGQAVGVVSSSISGRLALSQSASKHTADFNLLFAPVVHLQSSLASMLGEDYAAWPLDEIPETVTFEGVAVKARPFYADCREGGWLDIHNTMAQMRETAGPMVLFAGEDDRWVRMQDIEKVASQQGGGERILVQVKDLGHDFGRNAEAVRKICDQVVHWCRKFSGLAPIKTNEPSFNDLLKVGLAERRIQRSAT